MNAVIIIMLRLNMCSDYFVLHTLLFTTRCEAQTGGALLRASARGRSPRTQLLISYLDNLETSRIVKK